MQFGVGGASSKYKVSRAAFWVKTPGNRDRLQESRFAGTILANKKSDSRMQFEHIQMAHCRQ
jgi:hypothetical protein